MAKYIQKIIPFRFKLRCWISGEPHLAVMEAPPVPLETHVSRFQNTQARRMYYLSLSFTASFKFSWKGPI